MIRPVQYRPVGFSSHYFLKRTGDFVTPQAQSNIGNPQNRLFLVDLGRSPQEAVKNALKRVLKPLGKEALVTDTTSSLLVLTQDDAAQCPQEGWQQYLSQKTGVQPNAFIAVR